LFILYVAQGVPLGLFWFAIPSWMAANGASAADVGYVLGLTTLPWTLKLVNGFIMDRYTFLAMGRRRIWIIGAQTRTAWRISTTPFEIQGSAPSLPPLAARARTA